LDAQGKGRLKQEDKREQNLVNDNIITEIMAQFLNSLSTNTESGVAVAVHRNLLKAQSQQNMEMRATSLHHEVTMIGISSSRSEQRYLFLPRSMKNMSRNACTTIIHPQEWKLPFGLPV
jgi:hypothetical protein